MANLGIVSLNGKQVKKEAEPPKEEAKATKKKTSTKKASSKKAEPPKAEEIIEPSKPKIEIVGPPKRPTTPVEEVNKPIEIVTPKATPPLVKPEVAALNGPPKKPKAPTEATPPASEKPKFEKPRKLSPEELEAKKKEQEKEEARWVEEPYEKPGCPIPPSPDINQYRAIGILKGTLRLAQREEVMLIPLPQAPNNEEASEQELIKYKRANKKEKDTRYLILTSEGKEFRARCRDKWAWPHIEKLLGQEIFWVVYPWIQNKFGEPGNIKTLERILGFEVVANIYKQKQEEQTIKEEHGYFNFRGVWAFKANDKVLMKVYRNSQVKASKYGKYNKPPKFRDAQETKKATCTKLYVNIDLPPGRRQLGYFWDMDCTFDVQSGEFKLIEGRPIRQIHKIKKPSGPPNKKPYSKKKPEGEKINTPKGTREKE